MTDETTPAATERKRFNLAAYLKDRGYDPAKAKMTLTGLEWAGLPSLLRERDRIQAERLALMEDEQKCACDLNPIMAKLDKAAAQ